MAHVMEIVEIGVSAQKERWSRSEKGDDDRPQNKPQRAAIAHACGPAMAEHRGNVNSRVWAQVGQA